MDKHKSIINAIAISIENDEKGIRDLLKRNGVLTDFIKSKKALQATFLTALSKSRALAVDFHNYIQSKLGEQTLNVIGEETSPLGLSVGEYNPFQINTNKDILGGTTSLSTTSLTNSETTEKSTGFFSGINLSDLLNSGLKVLELQKDMQVSADNKQAVETAVQLKRDELNLQPTKSQANTGMIVAIVIGALVIVSGIIYVVTRKKAT